MLASMMAMMLETSAFALALKQKLQCEDISTKIETKEKIKIEVLKAMDKNTENILEYGKYKYFVLITCCQEFLEWYYNIDQFTGDDSFKDIINIRINENIDLMDDRTLYKTSLYGICANHVGKYEYGLCPKINDIINEFMSEEKTYSEMKKWGDRTIEIFEMINQKIEKRKNELQKYENELNDSLTNIKKIILVKGNHWNDYTSEEQKSIKEGYGNLENVVFLLNYCM